MTHYPPISRLVEGQPEELPERTATAAELADEHAHFEQARKPRLDGSIHDDRPPAPPAEPAFLNVPSPRLNLDRIHVRDRVADLGAVVLDLGDTLLMFLHSEEQAQALITAAGRAAAMFAHAKGAPAHILPPHSGAFIFGCPACDVAQQSDLPDPVRICGDDDHEHEADCYGQPDPACDLCGSAGHPMDEITNSHAPGGKSQECHDLHDCGERAAVAK